MMQKKLDNDAFWYFIRNPSATESPTRIEHIFDLYQGGVKDPHNPYQTFTNFYENSYKKFMNNVPGGILSLWREIKETFLMLEEWYDNKELYHLIGFLIACGEPLQAIRELAKEAENRATFKNRLDEEIRNVLGRTHTPLDDLNYCENKHKPGIRNALLLFNILTINSAASDTRFPFDRYKKEKWDIEHVRSQTKEDLKGEELEKKIHDVLALLSGYNGEREKKDAVKSHAESFKNAAENSKDGESDLAARRRLCERILTLLNNEKRNDNSTENMREAYTEILKYYGEDEYPDDIDNIANLALLDAATNRGYKNAVFPVKRDTIIKKDMRGEFVPPCTRNLFLKYYSMGNVHVFSWSKTDADAYLKAMKTCLKNHLPKEKEQAHNG